MNRTNQIPESPRVAPIFNAPPARQIAPRRRQTHFAVAWTVFLLALGQVVCGQSARENVDNSSAVDQRMVGNVYGTVADATTSRPVANAEILLFEAPRQGDRNDIIEDGRKEVFNASTSATAVRRRFTDDRGTFLINFVPTPYPGEVYTIVIRASGYRTCVFDRAHVLPGAVMALEIDCRLHPGRPDDVDVVRSADAGLYIRYRHKRVLTPEKTHPASNTNRKTTATEYTLFATREGLVGGTTANGHIIQTRDHFVALPSRRGLNPDDQTDHFLVELSWNGQTVRAPVWDVGPWNIKDDYWNPSNVREMWSDLPVGTPESQAAYLDDYNGGLDQFGRTVLNPAGIDLGDGTFWDDLAMLDNEWISVTFLWRPGVGLGDRIETTVDLNVRSEPAGDRLATVPEGSRGRITDGPEGEQFGNLFWIWWNVEWDDGVTTGWSVENWFVPVVPTAARPAWLRYE